MKFYCPKCEKEIQSEHINIATDLAKCQNCGEISKASALLKTTLPVSDTPPPGSKIEITKGFGGEVEIDLQKNGFTPKTIPLLIFSVFWMGFITFWTVGASKASIIFAAFSIPFWIVGVLLILGIVKSVTGSQHITLNRQNFSLVKKSIIGKKTFNCAIVEILAINKSKPLKKHLFAAYENIGNNQRQGGNTNTPHLVAAGQSISFFESANTEAQDWIVAYLNKEFKHLK